ncbi:MAG: TIGR02757 family protein [Candidatus Coatesbacteria bacterium]|nr:TIGR02757 family protein [Candidatus Coatesbacteria bacterium]
MRTDLKKNVLEQLYEKYNRREYVHPDPIEFLYYFDTVGDREIVGLIASSLAYGRVVQILRSIKMVLDKIGPSPREFLLNVSEEELRRRLLRFKHRFTTGEEMVEMLLSAKSLIERHGSLHECFTSGLNDKETTVLQALERFSDKLISRNGDREGAKNSLIPSPGLGSACKRINLFLRWMVREDEVDPGGWDGVPKSKLMIPLDTHMHRIGLALGLTGKKCADGRCAAEITEAFRKIEPDDPARYDFALTRLGIRPDCDMAAFLNELAGSKELGDD